MSLDEHTIDVGGVSVFYRQGPTAGGDILYLHSVPTSSDDWRDLLEQTGGVAPDLPGFGRSAKGTSQDYSLSAYADFVGGFLDGLELPEVTLVGHGWGAAAGLVFAQRHPDRVRRLAIVDAVPLLDGFTWPGMARWWRRPPIGELLMGSVTRRVLARLLRRGSVRPEAWAEGRIDEVWEQFDQGTQRAILRLHRSVDAHGLAAAGAELGELHAPALVVWGEQDPWLPPGFADAYARRLGAATVERVEGAGHWPWLDRPELIARLAAFAGDVSPA